jgi:hypothetical protein
VEFVCECSNPDCISTIELTVGEYERVRSNATWFVIKPDHDIPQIERVVSRDDGYAVVEKLIAEEYMEATDPRSDDTQRPPEGRRMRSVRKLSGRSIVCASSGIATTILQQRPRERARR